MQGQPDPRDCAFIDEPPAPQRRAVKYDILSPGAGATVSCVVLSHRPIITATHFQKRESFPCIGIERGCSWCKVNIAPRIRGWLAGLDTVKGRKVLVQLTKNCLDEQPLLKPGQPSIRGRTIYLKRIGEVNNGRVNAWFTDTSSVSVLKHLPPPFDVKEAVKKMLSLPTHLIDPESGEAKEVDHSEYFPDRLNPDQTEPAQGDLYEE